MLKTSRWILRVLNWLNWGIGVPIVVILALVTTIGAQPFIAAGGTAGVSHPQEILTLLRWMVILMVPVIALAHIIFTRLIAIIDTVPRGGAFTAANARRLRTIAWALLGTQIIDLIFGINSAATSMRTGEYIGWSFGLTGWIAVLLLFVLARIFDAGAAMQADLEGTV
ncbi:MAG: DUF2975 domain-containing protein [Sphingopyxis sp.]